eukprot:832388_1
MLRRITKRVFVLSVFCTISALAAKRTRRAFNLTFEVPPVTHDDKTSYGDYCHYYSIRTAPGMTKISIGTVCVPPGWFYTEFNLLDSSRKRSIKKWKDGSSEGIRPCALGDDVPVLMDLEVSENTEYFLKLRPFTFWNFGDDPDDTTYTSEKYRLVIHASGVGCAREPFSAFQKKFPGIVNFANPASITTTSVCDSGHILAVKDGSDYTVIDPSDIKVTCDPSAGYKLHDSSINDALIPDDYLSCVPGCSSTLFTELEAEFEHALAFSVESGVVSPTGACNHESGLVLSLEGKFLDYSQVSVSCEEGGYSMTTTDISPFKGNELSCVPGCVSTLFTDLQTEFQHALDLSLKNGIISVSEACDLDKGFLLVLDKKPLNYTFISVGCDSSGYSMASAFKASLLECVLGCAREPFSALQQKFPGIVNFANPASITTTSMCDSGYILAVKNGSDSTVIDPSDIKVTCDPSAGYKLHDSSINDALIPDDYLSCVKKSSLVKIYKIGNMELYIEHVVCLGFILAAMLVTLTICVTKAIVRKVKKMKIEKKKKLKLQAREAALKKIKLARERQRGFWLDEDEDEAAARERVF